MKKIVLLLAALVMVSSNGFSEEMKHKMKAQVGKKMPTRFQAVSSEHYICFIDFYYCWSNNGKKELISM